MRVLSSIQRRRNRKQTYADRTLVATIRGGKVQYAGHGAGCITSSMARAQGRIVHRNGLGWLSTFVSDIQHDRHFSPHRTEPGTKDSECLISDSIASSPFAFFKFMSRAALMFVIESQMLISAKLRPGHMLVDT